MKLPSAILVGVFAMVIGFSLMNSVPEAKTLSEEELKDLRDFTEQEKELYKRMQEHGITPENVTAIKRFYDAEHPGKRIRETKKLTITALYEHMQRYGLNDVPDPATGRFMTSAEVNKKLAEIHARIKRNNYAYTPADIAAIRRLKEAEIYAVMRHSISTGRLTVTLGGGFSEASLERLRRLYEEAPEESKIYMSFEDQQAEIYAHRKRHGVTRDNTGLNHLVMANGLFKPGEHYHFEMDEYILTMKVPEGYTGIASIFPYVNTRQPTRWMREYLEHWRGSFKVADLTWYTYGRPSMLGGKQDVSGVAIFYRILAPEDEEKYSTPERMHKTATDIQQSNILTQAEIERLARKNLLDGRVDNRIMLKPEPVVINGRIWIRSAMYKGVYGRCDYSYMTYLRPERFLVANFGPPRYDFGADADPLAAASAYPRQIREAIVRLNEMIASLRIARINDDGAPDPFVIERVEPAPLPVREKPPSVK